MSDDSETVEDMEKGSLAEVTDDSCTVQFIEIVPLDRASDDYQKLEFIDPVVEVEPEDLQEMEIKQEPADENENGDPTDTFTVERIDPTVEVKREDLLDVKEETSVKCETDGACFADPVQVRTTDHILLILATAREEVSKHMLFSTCCKKSNKC